MTLDSRADPEHEFGALLRDSRTTVGLTQEELAQRSGLSARSISDMERGKTAQPRIRSVRLLADAMGLSGLARDQLTAAAQGRPVSVDGLPGSASRTPQPVVPRQLPTAVRHFAGRASELATLQLLLDQAGAGGYAMPIAAIGGTAGVGKTALAIHWAHQVAGRFPDGQLYVDLHGHSPAGSPLTPAAVLRGFLDALGVEPGHQPVRCEEQAALYRSLLADRTMLVVLDNARDTEQVRLLLPGTPACLTVVTSRGEITALAASHGAALLTLDVLTTAEAAELLAGRLGSERVAAEPAAAFALSELCARLPLALGIAAARAAARPGLPLTMLTEELRDFPERLDGLDAGEDASDVRAVFSWSFRYLTDPAAQLFCLLGVHSGPDISLGAAASLVGLAPRATRPLIDELIRAGLLHEQVRHRYVCHDLLRAYAMERARAAEGQPGAIDCRAAMQRALDFYLHTAHAAAALVDPAQNSFSIGASERGTAAQSCTDRAAALTWFDAERHVLLAMTAQAAELGFDSHAWQLPCVLAGYLDLRGYWSDWAATQRIALAAAQRLGDEVGQAFANRSIGCAHSRLGSHEEALVHLREAANLFERLGDQIAVARCCLNVAHTFERQRRYPEALGYAEHALDLARAADAKLEQAAALNAIGWCRIHIGDYQGAVPGCQEALSLCRTLGDPRREAAALDSLGHAYQCLGQYAKAIACCARSAGLSRRVGDRFLESEALAHLGDAQHAIGRVGLARDSWQHALSILDELHDDSASEIRSKLRQIGYDAARLP